MSLIFLQATNVVQMTRVQRLQQILQVLAVLFAHRLKMHLVCSRTFGLKIFRELRQVPQFFERSSGHLKASAAPISTQLKSTFPLVGSPLNLPSATNIHTWPGWPASAWPIFFTNSKLDSPTYHVSTEGNRLLWQNQLFKIHYVMKQKCCKIRDFDTPNTTQPWEKQSLAVWQIFDPGGEA